MGTHERLLNPVLLVFVTCCAFLPSLSPAGAQTPEAPRGPRFEALVGELTAHLKRVDPQTETLPPVDFAAGKEWFNSPPLSLKKELRGKITILDFWTYCCINCIHVLPDLAELEEKYAGFPVAFVGVHSAKFDNEKDSENIRQAVLRYEIRHPVINDDEMSLWRAVGVRSWPTLVVIGPKGNLILMVSGEGKKRVLDACITAALRLLQRGAVPTRPGARSVSRRRPTGWRVAASLSGKGRRRRGPRSSFSSATPTRPPHRRNGPGGELRRGHRSRSDLVSWTARTTRPGSIDSRASLSTVAHLYVADAENHALRRVDLDAKDRRDARGQRHART